MKLIAKVYHADTPNINGIIYPKEELEKAVNQYNQNKNNFVVIGELTTSIDINIENVVGTAKLSIDNDYVIANIKLLNVQKSEPLIERINAGCDINLMPSATGILNNDNNTIDDMVIIKLNCTDSSPSFQTDLFKLHVVED